MQCDCLKDSRGWFSHCLHDLSSGILSTTAARIVLWSWNHLVNWASVRQPLSYQGSSALLCAVFGAKEKDGKQKRKMGSNICRRKLSIGYYSTLALLPGISEGEHGFLLLSDQMLAFLESFVCLGFIDDFTPVNSIWYSHALLGALKCCRPSNQKQVVLSVFGLHVFSKTCICSKNNHVVL